MPNDLYVAETILQQLGDRRFKVMTGCHNFVGDKNSLRFSLPTDLEIKDNINQVTIILEPDDTYTMVFIRKNHSNLGVSSTVPIHRFTGVYCDMLQDMFTTYTGLYTHL